MTSRPRRLPTLLALALVVAGCAGAAGGLGATPMATPGGSADRTTAGSPGRSAAPIVRTPLVVPTADAAQPPIGVPLVTRVAVPEFAIDLPVVSGLLELPGNDGYPLCDVAQYLTAYRQPAQPGTTYLYAHARSGMFLPLLEASRTGDDAELLGREVLVYTADGTIYRYVVSVIKRNATDFKLADSVRPGNRFLVLQTSEGPEGTVPKLQVGARLVEMTSGPVADAIPTPLPRVCR